MSLSDRFIKRPVLTTVCSILIVLVGIIAIPTLSIENLPNIAPPLVTVTSNYGGANSLVTEQAVTNPLEQQINGVPGAAYISSFSTSQGQSTIQVYFDEDTDINIDQVNVQNRVSLAMPQLPQQVQATGVSGDAEHPVDPDGLSGVVQQGSIRLGLSQWPDLRKPLLPAGSGCLVWPASACWEAATLPSGYLLIRQNLLRTSSLRIKLLELLAIRTRWRLAAWSVTARRWRPKVCLSDSR
jgi:hypothetical protein